MLKKIFKENKTDYIKNAIFIAKIENDIMFFDGCYNEYGIRSNDHNCLYGAINIEPSEIDKLFTIACICPEQNKIICCDYNFNQLKDYLQYFIDKRFEVETWD